MDIYQLAIKFEKINLETHVFKIPIKEIKFPNDIRKWRISEAYNSILEFIMLLSKSIQGRKISDSFNLSKICTNILNIFKILKKWIEDIPLITQPQRYGNKAFRDWFLKLQQNISYLLIDALGNDYIPAIPELSTYFLESFGNSTRLDYGTGHELSFIAFMFCLFKVGALCIPEDLPIAVSHIFTNYIELVRNLQMRYNLEPAGSQGVWNLDDFQFVLFIFGSSQLIDNPVLKPESFLDKDLCNMFSNEFMFFDGIKHINKVKTGPFSEHSNQLWNISAVPNWNKVYSGLIKMYQAEVLSKFPIIQHFMFGSLLRIDVKQRI